ncbi:MAG: GNAT family N-acetyltransferase [Oscillospiraceae bacterium]|nr:GNAT family N-acetyltransferase [Oscillospiraceae bacterium]
MIKLNKNQIEKLLPFYTGQTPLELQFALELQYAYNNGASVYTDDAGNPNMLLIVTVSPFGSVWVHLSGNVAYDKVDNDLNDFLSRQFALLTEDDMRAHSGEKGAVCLHLYSPGWLPKLEKLFDGHIRDKWIRYNYRLNKEVFSRHSDWREKIPDGFEMRYSDISFWRPESKKFDFSLVKDDEKISSCGIIYFEKESYNAKTERVVEIGIETKEEYRRKGFAFLTCSAFVEYCLLHDLEPNWGCYQFNPDSQALAKKLGFEEISQKNVLILGK